MILAYYLWTVVLLTISYEVSAIQQSGHVKVTYDVFPGIIDPVSPETIGVFHYLLSLEVAILFRDVDSNLTSISCLRIGTAGRTKSALCFQELAASENIACSLVADVIAIKIVLFENRYRMSWLQVREGDSIMSTAF
ncbi:hypothetical protein NECAME_05956 [Necator americanus]|uniref:Uncharacterized protein n=1 Tax=Necator americanus TaxID=51031 RepID=W2TXQ7_NECAM|nr:hypothetical protein NECAME_05956 [Necator americanus]ETN86464.1 hypothetical protein NECAME_05956 [Necator americanus]